MGAALCSSQRRKYLAGLIALYLFAADIGKLKIFPGRRPAMSG